VRDGAATTVLRGGGGGVGAGELEAGEDELDAEPVAVWSFAKRLRRIC
jgi:hypothetical protein